MTNSETIPVVSIHGLTKDYETGFWKKKKVRALDGVSFTVKPGHIFGFLGGNGAGKTTTIKMLMGLIFPTSGTATILGKDINDVAMHQEIGYCPENPYFYDYLTPLELLDYFGSLFGLSAQVRTSRAKDLLTLVGLEEKAWSRQMRKFSKGMLQRVGLAQSLINDPKVVFMDEPMSGLDPIGRREVREMIASLRDQGKTVMMSTHILGDVEALCDEVAILKNGKLAASGNLYELLAQNETSRSYEITLGGISLEKMIAELGSDKAIEISQKASGITIVVPEGEVEAVIRTSLQMKAKLQSVVPVKESLEDLFLASTRT